MLENVQRSDGVASPFLKTLTKRLYEIYLQWGDFIKRKMLAIDVSLFL